MKFVYLGRYSMGCRIDYRSSFRRLLCPGIHVVPISCHFREIIKSICHWWNLLCKLRNILYIFFLLSISHQRSTLKYFPAIHYSEGMFLLDWYIALFFDRSAFVYRIMIDQQNTILQISILLALLLHMFLCSCSLDSFIFSSGT